jgi:hypothetical protein
VRPASDKGEELRDVILWLVVLHYAKQSKTHVAFVSGDKTFQDAEGALHSTLKNDIERASVNVAFYSSVGGFVKYNALESEPLERDQLATFVSADELRGVATEQLLGSRFWYGTIVAAEVCSANWLRLGAIESQRIPTTSKRDIQVRARSVFRVARPFIFNPTWLRVTWCRL